MRKKLSLILCTLLLVFGINEYIGAAFTGGGAFGVIANYLKVVNTNILPSADNTYDLGSAAKSFKDAHIQGTATIGTLSVTDFGTVGSDTITVTINNDVLLSGTGHVTSGSEGFIVGTLTITDGSIDDSDGTIALGDTALTGVGEVTLIDGASINLQEALTFTGATTENKIEMPDDLAVALDITEAGNSYIHFVTTNGSEAIVLSENVTAIAAITTFGTAGLHLLDTGADHDLIITYNEDATQDNTLNIVLADANRTLTISGASTIDQNVSTAGTPSFAAVTSTKLIHGTESVTPTDGGIAASVDITVTLMTSESDEADADAISLADGTLGQIKIFIFKTETDEGDTIVLTPNTPVGFATITFDDPGDTCTLIFDGTSWVIISTYGTS